MALLTSINKVQLLGRIGKDPEQSSEKAPAKLDVVTSVRWKDRDSGEWKEKSTWHNKIEFWGKTAEYVMNNLHQGDTVLIEGELATDQWEDKDTGQKRNRYFIKGTQINLVERNTKNQEPNGGDSNVISYESKKRSKSSAQEELVEDSVPF